MFGYIYITTNLLNNKKYIGKQKSEKFNSNYLGSGVYLNRAINKYGRENFKTEIIEWVSTNQQDLNEREKYWISYYNACESNEFYNISKGGDGGNVIAGLSKEDYDKFIEKCAKSSTGRKHTEETKRKISKIHKGVPKSEKHKKSLSINHSSKKEGYVNPNTGNVYSIKHRKKLSNAHKGIPVSDSQRNKVSENMKNRIHLTNGFTERIIKKDLVEQFLQDNKDYYIGTKPRPKRGPHSAETIQKICNNRPDVSGEKNPTYGKRFVTDGSTNKLINPDEIDDYISSGWKAGFTRKEKQICT